MCQLRSRDQGYVVHFMDCIYIYAMNLVKYNGLEMLDSISFREHVEAGMA